MVLPLLLPLARPIPVHPLRLASLAASLSSVFLGSAKGTEIPRYACNDSGVRAPFVLADISPASGGTLRLCKAPMGGGKEV